jgi:hypothetical protein
MPSSLLICESCGNRQTFFLDEPSLEEVKSGKAITRHCLRCRTTTDWSVVRTDGRSGRERRWGDDRREG